MFGKAKMRPRLVVRANTRRLPLGRTLNRLKGGWGAKVISIRSLSLIASPLEAVVRRGAKWMAVQVQTPRLHEVA